MRDKQWIAEERRLWDRIMNDTEGRAILHGIPKDDPRRNHLLTVQLLRNATKRAGAWRSFSEFVNH
jgi:hypothetical protein